MKEREYCLKVKDIDKSIEFIKKEGFILQSENNETRTIFRNPNKTMARITKESNNDGTKTFLDFKEDNLSGNALNIRKESLALEFVDQDAVLSILDFLNYKQDNTLIRKRWVFVLGKVICEVDAYYSPSENYVVSIEGEDFDAVDKFYNKLLAVESENE